MNRDLLLNIKRRLKRTWNLFFSKFGNLRPVQIATIPLVLNRKNVIVSSPTASGKTEALIAPLVEILLHDKWEYLSILYISPTRALVNDIELRLKELLKELNLILSIKTGDRPYINYKKPPNVLITTPESLDSLICRHPNFLKSILVLILDEIHILDGTYRGDQVRLLIKRLKEVSDFEFNIYLLSATIPDCYKMGSRYLHNFEVVKVSSSRKINSTLVSSFKEIINYMRKERLKKILVFGNSRKNVESLSLEIKNLNTPFQVVTHHGSLSKFERETSEKFMKSSKYGICVATMTLEIGIDIGDIDAVVLAEIPWSISGLIQRTGRANRRTNKNRVFAIYQNEEQKDLLKIMFELANNGELETKNYSPDLSVVIQQIFSCLYSHPEGLRDDYFKVLFENFCEQSSVSKILKNLDRLGWIKEKSEKWFGTTKLMDVGQFGFIHSNIPDDTSLKVIDVKTGRVVGYVMRLVDNIFILAGRIWRIIKYDKDTIFVTEINQNAYLPEFQIKNGLGRYFLYLPKDIRNSEKYSISF